VKHWVTLNEPWAFSKYGYADGISTHGKMFNLAKQRL